MEDVIASILKIEENAKTRLEEAEKKKNQLIADAKAEQEKLIKDKIKEADEKLNKMSLDEKKKAEQKLAEIEESTKKEIARLDNVFEKSRRKWEDEIFKSIVNV
ncbi:MAG: hypothetical protein NC253_01250 [Ruminococcus sp.]|nr:hypothetical protein [Ruminococcus sp.]MCM1382292.1 hypothetical protein [Muribaculaceae bacterium]